jgi:hypothetical protein
MLKTSIAALLIAATTSSFAATILTETFEGINSAGASNTGSGGSAGGDAFYTFNAPNALTGADNGWAVTGTSVDVVVVPDFGAFPAPSTRSLELSGSPAPGGISLTQSIATVLGTTYQLTFGYAGNPGVADLSNPHSASTPFYFAWNGGTTFVTTPSPALPGAAGVVNYASTSWLSDGSNLSLSFYTLLAASSGTVIDNISVSSITEVSAVPEPGEWAMMIAGLGVVSVIARRRKQQA